MILTSKTVYWQWVSYCILVVTFAASGAEAAEYKTYADAFREGSKLLREKQDAASQAPLEAALRLATNDEQRLQAYKALTRAYRTLPEIDKMLEAQEFIIRHSDRSAGRSNAAGDVVSFLHQRGKLDAGIERYEAELKKNADDPAAVTILAEIYEHHRKDAREAAAYQDRREKLNQTLAEALAAKLEADAKANPQLASWHLKDAAHAWLEAGDKAKALAAAKKSAAGTPERRSTVLSFYWHEGLAKALHQAGDPKSAILQYELAIPLAPSQIHVRELEKKLEEAKEAASM
jgi:hypothetical protein